MKRLFVGCRVRVVKNVGCSYWDYTVGKEARITEIYPEEKDWPIGYVLDAFVGAEFEADELEPIQDPDLNKVITWADMADLWTPSGVEA